MARAVTPAGGGGGGDGAAWLIPGAGVCALAAAGALWVAGGVACLLAGRGWVSAPFTMATFVGVLRAGTAASWPGADPRVVVVLAGLLVLLVVGPLVVLAGRAWLRQPPADDPARSLARGVHLRAFLPRPAAERAQRLRPSLAGCKAAELAAGRRGDVGITLGTLGRTAGKGPALLSSWEDVLLALMAPRSGKTTSLAVPVVLAAPGAAVLTSNKTEGWKETAALRAALPGAMVWTFDPQRIAHEPQTWWWNPLRGVTTVREATRLAGHFISTVEGDRNDVWAPAAKELLANLLLAAALGGRTMIDVYEWLADEGTPVPRSILAEHGFGLLASTLRGTQDLAAETRSGVYFNARAATQCLRDDQITAWITPPAAPGPLDRADDRTADTTADRTVGEDVGHTENRPHPPTLVEFIAEDLPTARDTLYLLSKDEGGSAGPLVAALTDRVMRAGIAAAERRGARLDPPLVLVLDEAANVCRIGDLPDLYSHLGSRGIVPLTILQSYAQAESVWGKSGAAKLWGAATVKLVGAGMDDADFAEDVSRLVGDHDVLTVSRASGGKGGSSRTHSTRSQRILSAAAVRQLPKGSALLLATGTKPALIRLLPWYRSAQAGAITAAAAAADQLLSLHAAPAPAPDPTPDEDAAPNAHEVLT